MKRSFTVISVIIIMAIITVFTMGCHKDPYIPDALDVEAGSMPDSACAIIGDELALINAGLDEDATEAEVKTAVLALFNAADRVQREANLVFTISDGGGYAKSGAEGYMTVRGFYFRNGNSYYSQSAGEVTDANVGPIAATTIARNMLDQLSRTYTADMQTFYREKAEEGKYANKPDVSAYDHFPYVTADFARCTSETFNHEEWIEEARILNNVGELSNFDFNVNAIKDAEISHNTDEHFYQLKFSLDTSNKDDAYVDVVNFAREGLREASNSDDLDYVVYDVIMEVWDNGYIRSFSSVENWEATLNILGGIHGVSDSSNVTVYYWDWEEIEEVIDDCEDYDDMESPEDFLEALKWFE